MQATAESLFPGRVPRPGSRVVVAMSGGVDSSVAAACLVEAGYEVIGISLQLHDMAVKEENRFGSCCSLSDMLDARGVCERLGIPFYVKDMEKEFEEAVIDDFVGEYLQGRTPNPCVRCNEKVKFRRLLDWALDLGADYLATGHYAQTTEEADGTIALRKGVDRNKDQSYFLFTLQQEELAKTIFPIGHMDKTTVREIARRHGLMNAEKPDSQEICFVQGKSYREFVEEKVPAEQRKPGRIVDTEGKDLGTHEGLFRYTIGQRKGLGVFAADPLFVVALDPKTNSVVVGKEEKLFCSNAVVESVRWTLPNPPTEAVSVAARIRYRSLESAALAVPGADGRCDVKFSMPQRAITPGQAVVFYDGDRVLGGGWVA